MAEKMTPAEVEAFYMEQDAQGPGVLSTEEAEAMKAAGGCPVDGGSAPVMDECSGRLVIRIPRSLHKKLREQAAAEGVSLNQYALWKLAVDITP